MQTNNVIIIHGGGLCEPSKHVLMRIAENLSKIYDKTYIGRFSFESLYTPEFIIPYNDELIQKVNGKRGSYFGTSRGIDLYNDSVRFKKSVECLKKRNIKTIIVAGGDGSSRQVAEINEAFMKHGINIIFPIPLTIDGINGGLSIGINEAVKESIRQIENIASASLQTRDYEQYSVVMVELQGRNHDDIMANVLKFFDIEGHIADYRLEELTLKVVPTTLESDSEKLIDEINNSSKRTLILLSEGAKDRNPILSIHELTKRIDRKVRSLVVGHPLQSNNMSSHEDIMCYDDWINTVCWFILNDPYTSYSIANNNKVFSKKPINYYAELNPRNGQKAELSEELKCLIALYMSGK